MYRKSFLALVVPVVFAMAGTVTPTEDAEAGTILMFCWAGLPVTGPQPSPTVGCTMEWFAGGPATHATFGIKYTCLPNCVAQPAQWSSGTIDIETPSAGEIDNEVERNCTGVTQTGIADGTAGTWFVQGLLNYVIVQNEASIATGPVAPWCP